MENIRVVRLSHIERIRSIASQWLTRHDGDAGQAMRAIINVLLEPEPLELRLPPQMPGESLGEYRARIFQGYGGHQIQLADSRRNRVYLAGPMTGYEDHNFPAFNAEAARLRSTGLDVVNPAEHGIVEAAEWGDYLRYDIAKLANCEAIHFLPGWQASKGAQLEHSVAKALGMPMTFAEGAQPELDDQQTAAARDVLAERRRQVEKEGWTQEHDDEHDAGELAAAASAYALYASDELNPHWQGDGDYGRKEPDMWPFEASGWKPSNPRRALTKAGALILAEIERWDRMVAGITTHTDEQDGVKCIVTAKHNDNGTTELLDVSFDEARMDVIGQNGPTGEHYAELAEVAIQNGGKPVAELPDGLSWEQAPEWATVLLRHEDGQLVWAERFENDAKAETANRGGEYLAGITEIGRYWIQIACRPRPRRDATQA